jgi:hypothetical protein
VLAHVLLFFQLSAVVFLAATDAGGSVAVGAAGMGWSR